MKILSISILKPIELLAVFLFAMFCVWSAASLFYSFVNQYENTASTLLIADMFVSLYIFVLIWQWTTTKELFSIKTIFQYLVYISVIYNIIFWLFFIVYMHVLSFGEDKLLDFNIHYFFTDLAFFSYVLSSFIIAKKIVSMEWRSKAIIFDYIGLGIKIVFFPMTLFMVQGRVHNLLAKEEK